MFTQEAERIFLSIPDVLCVLESNGRFCRVNTAWMTAFGFYPACDRSYFDFVHPDDLEQTAEAFAKLDAGPGRPSTWQNRYRLRDGSHRWVEWTAGPEAGSERIYVVGRDISRWMAQESETQKRLEEELQLSHSKYRSLVENAPFGVYRTSLDGRFLDVNHTMVAMLDYESREQVMALNIESDVYREPGKRSELIRQFGDVERLENVFVEWKRKDGRPLPVRLSARKLRDAFGVLEGFEVIAEEDVLHRRSAA